jgi:ATP-dependent exoDNAse (exonuclease V) beta subunit
MTGHKSKGLEYDTVFLLDRDLIKIEDGQEKNLLYVCQTRAKKELFYVTSDAFHDEAGE